METDASSDFCSRWSGGAFAHLDESLGAAAPQQSWEGINV